MKHRLARSLVSLAFFATACDPAAAPERDPPSPVPAAPANQPAAQEAPELLWVQYQSLHFLVNERNAEWIGRDLEVLMSGETRALIDKTVDRSLRRMEGQWSMAAELSAVEVRNRILGRAALAHREQITRSRLVGFRPQDEEHGWLVIGDGIEPVWHLPVVREGGAWRLALSSRLFAAPEKLYPLPPRAARRRTPSCRTAAELAAALVAAIDAGTGWDLHDLLADDSRASVRHALAAVGLPATEADLVRTLDGTIRAIRNQQGTPRIRSVTHAGSDRARIWVEFTNGTIDSFNAVRQVDGWRLEFKP